MKVIHNIKPIYNKNSKILILGSMPSITSRNNNFYYSNKSNRFWPIINKLFNVNLNTIEDKINFLLNNNIALWDIIKSCDINASQDSSIKNIEINNINKILKHSKIKHIYCEGLKAYQITKKYYKNLNIPITYLSSTSSAYAKKTLDDLVKEFEIIKNNLL